MLKKQYKRILENKLKVGKAYDDNDLIVATQLGNFISHRNLTRSFNRAIEKSGLPKITFHELRHTHATILLSKGEPIKAVAERLGHSVKVLMETYAHVIPSLQSTMADKYEKSFETL